MTYLLDVNLLIALFDADHIHHTKARLWFESEGKKSWATCPLTENGMVRIMSSPSYGTIYSKPAQIISHLKQMQAKFNKHKFVSDNISLLDEKIFDLDMIIGTKQISDSYLVGLAYKNKSRLATFDKGISDIWLNDKRRNVVVHL